MFIILHRYDYYFVLKFVCFFFFLFLLIIWLFGLYLLIDFINHSNSLHKIIIQEENWKEKNILYICLTFDIHLSVIHYVHYIHDLVICIKIRFSHSPYFPIFYQLVYNYDIFDKNLISDISLYIIALHCMFIHYIPSSICLLLSMNPHLAWGSSSFLTSRFAFINTDMMQIFRAD